MIQVLPATKPRGCSERRRVHGCRRRSERQCRFAAAISSIKTFAVVGIVSNFKEIGTAIGEGIAKMQGYGRAIADAEGPMRA